MFPGTPPQPTLPPSRSQDRSPLLARVPQRPFTVIPDQECRRNPRHSWLTLRQQPRVGLGWVSSPRRGVPGQAPISARARRWPLGSPEAEEGPRLLSQGALCAWGWASTAAHAGERPPAPSSSSSRTEVHRWERM